MNRRQSFRALAAVSGLLFLAACTPPAPPQPTAAPAKPAESKPAEATKPTESKPAVAPTAVPAEAPKPATQGERLVAAVTQFGTETPFAWKSVQNEKNLWEVVYDPLIQRDQKTWEYRPGLATEWSYSPDYKVWTFKLRRGVSFHEGWGELTAEDVKFTVEQNLKPDSGGGDAPFFRQYLDRIEIPDSYAIVLHFKSGLWEVPSHFAQTTGYQWIISKRYFEAVGEEKAALHPIGTGPWRHVEGRQGELHRFEAVSDHWRQPPRFKELLIRRVADPATAMAGLRTGEIDIAAVTGDQLQQATGAGLRIVDAPNAFQFWITLPGQTTPDYEDYCPTCPWVGDPNDAQSQANALKVRQALNLAINRPAIMRDLWQGTGTDTPFSYWYYPFQRGYSQDWKLPPYDPERAKQLMAEAGLPGGFEIKMNPYAQNVDGADVMEAVALDWEKVGIRVRRHIEDIGTFSPKGRQRKTGVVGRPYSPPSPNDEPSLTWQRTIHTKGTFNLLAEGPWDTQVEAIAAELDPDRRTAMTVALADQLYREYRGAMVGMKAATWAVTTKVGDWPVMPYTNLGTNYEYITPGG